MTQLERSIEILQHIGFRIRQGKPNAFTYHLYSPIYNTVYNGVTNIQFFYCLESKDTSAWAINLRDFLTEKSKSWNVDINFDIGLNKIHLLFNIILDFPKVHERCKDGIWRYTPGEIDYSIMCQSYDHCNYFTDGAMSLDVDEFNKIFLTEWREINLSNILSC